MWCSSADIHLKLLDHVVSGAQFDTTGVCLSVELHMISLWQYYMYMLYKIRCNPIHPLHILLYLADQCGFHAVLWSHIGPLIRLLAEEPHNTAGLYFSVSISVER